MLSLARLSNYQAVHSRSTTLSRAFAQRGRGFGGQHRRIRDVPPQQSGNPKPSDRE